MLEAGYDTGGTSAFDAVFGSLAEVSRVCTYDRAGTGNSEARPAESASGLTSLDQAHELHALLERAEVPGPYVVVGHSYGGFVSRLFAAAYPEDVEGLVLIESSHEDEIVPYRRFYENGPEADWDRRRRPVGHRRHGGRPSDDGTGAFGSIPASS